MRSWITWRIASPRVPRAATSGQRPSWALGGRRSSATTAWGYLRPVFQVAHRYYRDHGMYDFPHKSLKNWLLITGGMLFVNFPGVRKRFYESIKRDMIVPLQKILAGDLTGIIHEPSGHLKRKRGHTNNMSSLTLRVEMVQAVVRTRASE